MLICSKCCDISGYHWDCSDWVNRSQNPLPNITEVPGSEVPDSSSFHSNESNESNTHQGNMTLPPGKCLQLSARNGDTLFPVSASVWWG